MDSLGILCTVLYLIATHGGPNVVADMTTVDVTADVNTDESVWNSDVPDATATWTTSSATSARLTETTRTSTVAAAATESNTTPTPTTMTKKTTTTTTTMTTAGATSATSTTSTSTSPATVTPKTGPVPSTTWHFEEATASILVKCSSMEPCQDPHSHCVNWAGRNICQCRKNYRLDVGGICQSVRPEEPPGRHVPAATTQSTTTEAQEGGECDVVSRDADNLTALERRDVVSMRLKPAVSAVHWIRAKDRVFRATVADILTNISQEDGVSVSISAKQIWYVAPTPLVFSGQLHVSILVDDPTGVSDDLRSAVYKSTPSRHRRVATRTFPAEIVLAALHRRRSQLQQALGQNVTHVSAEPPTIGVYDTGPANTFWRRHTNIWVPVLVALTSVLAFFCFGVVCIRLKTRFTWDPPNSATYGKANFHQQDRLVGGAVHLASDEACRQGERDDVTDDVVDDATPTTTAAGDGDDGDDDDDDAWPVPYASDDAAAAAAAAPPNGGHHVTLQFQDTRL